MRSIEQIFDQRAPGRPRLSVLADRKRTHVRIARQITSFAKPDDIRRFPMSSTTIPTTVRPASARPAAAPRARSARPAEPVLRLTRRGRVVAFLTFLLAACAVLVFMLSGAATGTPERGTPVPVKVVQVEPGDTLWSIATRAAPGEDPRDLIDEIEELNSLDGSLPVGSSVAVPLDH
jgi:Tfp pilus assembly protein FimV